MSNIKKFDQQVWINDKMSIGDDYQQEPRVTIDMSGKTDAIFVPVGDNSERPINTGNTLNQIDTLSGNGFLRYNKETQKFEGYEDLQWKNFITSNANMQFIPNYYVIDETELDAAYSDINTNYNGGNIYIADEVILTSNKTWDLQGINFYSAGGWIRFNNQVNDINNVYGYTITITNGRPTFTDIYFNGSNGNTDNNFNTINTRTLFNIGIYGTNLPNTSVNITFKNCIFQDVIGQTQNPVINILGTITQNQEIRFKDCKYSSHDSTTSYPYDVDYKGFIINYSGSTSSGAHGLFLEVNGQKVENGSLNYSGNLYGMSGNDYNESPTFKTDESAYITNTTYTLTQSLIRNNSFYVNKTETSMQDTDYLFFNDSSGSNGVNNNIKKITKADLLINSSNVQVEPDMSIQFASGTTQTGSTDFLYDYSIKSIEHGDNIFNTATDSILSGNYLSGSSNNIYMFGTYLDTNSNNSFIGGGGLSSFNNITYESTYSFNYQVVISSNKGLSDSNYSTIIGGLNHYIKNARFSFIGGGRDNQISRVTNNSPRYSAIIAGGYNSIFADTIDNSHYTFIGGGSGNTINHANYSSIIVGKDNIINGIGKGDGCGVILGGNSNILYGDETSIIGGKKNIIETSISDSAILSGVYNVIGENNTSTKYYNTIIGGSGNTIIDFNYSAIISGNKISAIRNNLVHVPDLYIHNLSGQSANIIIDSNGILVTGTSSEMVQYLDDLLDVIAPSGSSQNGDYLIFDSSQNQWVASGITSDELSAGTGISIDDSVSGYVIISATATGSYTLSADTGSGVVSDSDTITFTGDNIISTTYSNSAITISADLSDYLTGVTLTENQVAFGNTSNQISSSSELTWDDTYLKVSGSSSESVVISATGSYYIGDPSTDGSWRFKINSSGNLVIEKRVSSSWEIGQTISV